MRGIGGRRDIREIREIRDIREIGEIREIKGIRDIREIGDIRDIVEVEIRDGKKNERNDFVPIPDQNAPVALQIFLPY